jgi:hypothetical protein
MNDSVSLVGIIRGQEFTDGNYLQEWLAAEKINFLKFTLMNDSVSLVGIIRGREFTDGNYLQEWFAAEKIKGHRASKFRASQYLKHHLWS